MPKRIANSFSLGSASGCWRFVGPQCLQDAVPRDQNLEAGPADNGHGLPRLDATLGHYVAYVRGGDDFWYECDDWCKPARVLRSDAVFAHDPRWQAYVFFYER